MQKRWVKIAIGIVAAVILLLIIVPLFVNAETFRPTIENELSTQLGRRVTFGHLSFSLFSGSLVADDINVADDPSFSTLHFSKPTS
jgi:AsmA protein